MINQDPPDVLLAYFMDNPSPATYAETLRALQQREERLVRGARINEAIKAIDIMIEPTKKFTGQDGPLISQFASIMMKQKNRITSLKAKEKS